MSALLGVVGDVVEDIAVYTDTPFAVGSDTPSQIVRRMGGSAANVAVAAGALVKTRFFGCVGNDDVGRRLALELGDALDARVQVDPREPTGTIVVIVDGEGERHMLPHRGANVNLGPVDEGLLVDLDALHATVYSLAEGAAVTSVTAAMLSVGGRGRVTSLDVSSAALIEQIGPRLLAEEIDLLRPTVVFANAAEAALLGWDVLEPSAGRVVIVKHGAGSALVRTPKGAWPVPTRRVEVSDTTGAGDAFAAGVLAYVLNEGLGVQTLLGGGAVMSLRLAGAGHKAASQWLVARRGK